MSPSSPANRKLSNSSPTRNSLVERCSSLKGCEPCKRRKRICNGQKPCTHCVDASHDCVYSVVSDHSRSVFSTSTARRLSSGSACETCRRRKTKCDGGSPCGFCASSGIECVNNSERRKRSIAAASSSSNSNLPSTPSSLSSNSSTIADVDDNEAIDRIEDRLRRIEKLMTAFSPSPLSQQAQFTNEIKNIKRVTAGFRKLSSPHLPKPTSPSARQHRHSIQGLSTHASSSSSISSAASERTAMINKDKGSYHSPPNSNDSLNYHNFSGHVPSPSPPLSPHSLRQQSQSQHATNIVASTLLNLSLSPSSSTSSSSTTYQPSPMQPSESTPLSPLAGRPFLNSMPKDNESSVPPSNEWKQATPIPSLMDQLSRCTFVTTAMDYTAVHYPIYPISTTTNSTINKAANEES